MARPIYVGGKTATKAGATSGNTTVAINSGLTGGVASAAAAGDLVIVHYATGSTVDRTLLISDGSTDYTLIADVYSNGSAYDTNLRVAYKVMGGTPDTTVTLGPTQHASEAGSISIRVWRGVDASNPLDVAAVTATGTGTTRPTPPAITPITTDAVIEVAGAGCVATGIVYNTATLTDFLSANSVDTNDSTIGSGYFEWVSGTYTPAQFGGGVTQGNDSWAAVSYALRPAGGPISGAHSVTLGDVVSAGAAALLLLASSAITLDGVASSATGTVSEPGTSGQSAITLDGAAGAASGNLAVRAQGSVVLDGATGATSGVLATHAQSAVTLEGATGAVSATLAVKAQAVVFLDGATASAQGRLALGGLSGVVLDGALPSASGAVDIAAQSAITLDGATTQATGGFGAAPIIGQSAITLDAVTGSAQGALAIGGQGATILDGVAAAGAGVLRLAATAGVMLDGVSGSASGIIQIVGLGGVTLDGVVAESAARLSIYGAATVVLDDLSSAATATIIDADALPALIVAGTWPPEIAGAGVWPAETAAAAVWARGTVTGSWRL